MRLRVLSAMRGVAIAVVMLAGVSTASAQDRPPDYQSAKPQKDANGQPIPGRFTVTICR